MFDSRSISRRCAAIVVFLMVLCHAGSVFALGFGAIRVNSSLNEPLDATLDLVSLSQGEAGSLSVGVAPPEMFRRFGIERSSLADELQVARRSMPGSDRVVVHLTTRRPVREPFLRFLIEANTSSGKALREYTVLLDPPGQSPRPSAAASAPAPASPASAPPSASRTTAARAPEPGQPRTKSDVDLPATPTGAGDGNHYGPVGRGDTLFGIATQTRRPGTTQDQMQVAIFRDNPQAFNGSMDMLLRGAMLSIPPAQRVAAIDTDTARAAIREQRQAVQEQAAASGAQDKPATESAPPRKTAARAATRRPSTTAATLQLEPPKEGAGMTAHGGNGALFGRLVEPDFDSLENETADTPATVEPAPARAIATAARANDQQSAQAKPTQAATPERAADAPAASAELENAGLDNGVVAADTPAEAAADSEPGTQAQAANADAAKMDDASVAGGSRPLSSEERDVVGAGGAGLLSPRNLMLLLALLLLIALLLVWNRRRQYKPVPLDFGPEDDPAEAAAGPAAAADESDTYTAPVVPTGQPAVEAGGVAPSVRVQDADRQMQLGLFADARTTLETGLEQAPADAGLQDKLLELDYLVGDALAFRQDLDRFGSGLSGDGVRWAGVSAMGRILLPEDTRFAAARPGRVSHAASPTPAPAPASAPVESATAVDEAPRGTPSPAGESVSAPTAPETVPTIAQADPLTEQAAAGTQETAERREPPPEEESIGLPPRLDPAPSLAAEGPRQSSEPNAAHDNALSLDTGEYDWQAPALPSGGERQHDRGDEPGMAFELDTSEFPDERETALQPEAQVGRGAAHDLPPIDTSEFDLGDGDGASDDSAGSDADPVEIRLDLARMYLEMEDNNAARELLEEAMADGNEQQRQSARELLDGI